MSLFATPSERDLASLQGDWRQVAMEADGVIEPPDTHGGAGAVTTIKGHHFRVKGLDGQVLLEGSFTLDASTEPRSITWVDSMGEDTGKALPAIYTLQEQRFVFIAADEGAARPSVFKTVPGLTMRSFERVA